ncbi:hypothetical protein K2173_009843 [Erythroxylum novogranatense]|uniref:1-phosphatidylinositol 4-kinase n=1 Tax=Erythroxylum novogranatense TaxID=1862640 RepID=A0AAV8SZ41_9ROSI|nr:hypothetical protein K2173_009843 [Erythroxylum novogranatense]
MAVAIDQHHGFKSFNRPQRCRLQSLTHFDQNIIDLSQNNLAHSWKQAFEVASIHRSFSTPCFSLASRAGEEFDSRPSVEIVGGNGAPRVRALVVEASIAMASGVDPIPVSNGLGGAYFLQCRNGNNIAVAKPIDEEPLAFNNPKGYSGMMLGQPGLKRSIRVGETGIRELAAYLLDRDGFAGVPPTALVKIAHVGFHVNGTATVSTPSYKIASLQRFVDHDFDAGELGPSRFSVSSVHRIGILDVRLLNLDRHAGNILVKKHDQEEDYAVGLAELVPIDHGLCLPEWLDDPYFEWLHWPQASVPFSEEELDYISNLDPLKDADLLKAKLSSLKESSIRVLIICTIFLKRAASAGLCLAEIGKMMTRELSGGGVERLSSLEKLCETSKARILNLDNDAVKNADYEQSRGGKENPEMFQFNPMVEVVCTETADLPQELNIPPVITKPLNFSSVRSLPQLHDETCTNKASTCGIEGVSLGDMSEGEWELFLETFDKLLAEVFEATASGNFQTF